MCKLYCLINNSKAITPATFAVHCHFVWHSNTTISKKDHIYKLLMKENGYELALLIIKLKNIKDYVFNL